MLEAVQEMQPSQLAPFRPLRPNGQTNIQPGDRCLKDMWLGTYGVQYLHSGTCFQTHLSFYRNVSQINVGRPKHHTRVYQKPD